ncbi:putative aquaporin TIP5-1, partial [Drosera capensis]
LGPVDSLQDPSPVQQPGSGDSHVNPAVTIAKVVSGHMPFVTAIFYWISQILGAIMGCLLLKITTVQHCTGYMTNFHHVAECYYSNNSTRNDRIRRIHPRRLPDFWVGLHRLCCKRPKAMPYGLDRTLVDQPHGRRSKHTGNRTILGGCMNPAYAFGSAAIACGFKNQAVYWLGPLFGAAIAGLLYGKVVFPVEDSDCTTRDTQDGFRV